MSPFRQFALAFHQFFKAIGFMRRHGMMWLLFFPLTLNLLFLFIDAHYTAQLSNIIVQQIAALIPDLSTLPNWLTTLMSVVGWLLILIFKMLLFLVLTFVSGFVVLILLSPVFSLTASKVMSVINSQSDVYGLLHWLRDMARGILLTFRNLLMELFLSLMLLLGGTIPVAGLLAPLALLLTSAYYYGFSFIDYSLEQKGYSISRSVWYVKNHRGLAIGSGLMFTLTMMIPFVGVFLAGFVGIVSVVGATLAVNQVGDLD